MKCKFNLKMLFILTLLNHPFSSFANLCNLEKVSPLQLIDACKQEPAGSFPTIEWKVMPRYSKCGAPAQDVNFSISKTLHQNSIKIEQDILFLNKSKKVTDEEFKAFTARLKNKTIQFFKRHGIEFEGSFAVITETELNQLPSSNGFEYQYDGFRIEPSRVNIISKGVQKSVVYYYDNDALDWSLWNFSLNVGSIKFYDLNERAYLSFIHEFMHSLGLPDEYSRPNSCYNWYLDQDKGPLATQEDSGTIFEKRQNFQYSDLEAGKEFRNILMDTTDGTSPDDFIIPTDMLYYLINPLCPNVCHKFTEKGLTASRLPSDFSDFWEEELGKRLSPQELCEKAFSCSSVLTFVQNDGSVMCQCSN